MSTFGFILGRTPHTRESCPQRWEMMFDTSRGVYILLCEPTNSIIEAFKGESLERFAQRMGESARIKGEVVPGALSGAALDRCKAQPKFERCIHSVSSSKDTKAKFPGRSKAAVRARKSRAYAVCTCSVCSKHARCP